MRSAPSRPKRTAGRTLLAIAGRHVDFAGPNHPGWLRFLDRVGLEHPEGRATASAALAPDALAAGLLASSGVGALEMTEGARLYLGSRLGIGELLAEGACLADAALDRGEVWAEIGDLADGAYRRLAVVSLG